MLQSSKVKFFGSPLPGAYAWRINIIFSPCASSFDQFKNFEDRGDFFKKTVKKSVKIEK